MVMNAVVFLNYCLLYQLGVSYVCTASLNNVSPVYDCEQFRARLPLLQADLAPIHLRDKSIVYTSCCSQLAPGEQLNVNFVTAVVLVKFSSSAKYL
jgi:hypothetical protein